MTDSTLALVANAGGDSISTFRIADGKLERLAVTPGLAGCSAFAIDSARDLVYAAVEGDEQRADRRHPAIVTLRLARETGALTEVLRRDLPDGALNYVALTRDGAALLGASYDGGYGVVCALADGRVGEPVARVEFANLHSVLASGDGRFAYFVSLGDDLVAQYALEPDLHLTPLDPAVVAAPAGSGPRHLVFNEAEDEVYVLTEFSAEVLRFGRDTATGTLTLRDAAPAFDPSADLGHSRFGADPRAEHLIWGADIHLGAAGSTLWCSERTESTLAAVALTPEGLVSPERFTVTERQPRGFALTPDGAHLLAAGEESTTVSLYAVDGDRLELLDRAGTGDGANWVRFV